MPYPFKSLTSHIKINKIHYWSQELAMDFAFRWDATICCSYLSFKTV